MRIGAEDIASQSWADSFVILIGCETAASDTGDNDMAMTFLKAGARAVVGTSSKVAVHVADFLFKEMLELLVGGAFIDYAFFIARRRASAYETFPM